MKRIACLFCAVALMNVGCGDDDSGTTEDSGTDTMMMAEDTGTMGDTSVPEDTTVSEDTSMPEDTTPPPVMDACDPFASGTCDEGKCSLAISRDDEGTFIEAYWACVDDSVAKDEGIPCARSIDATPDDSADNSRADDCAEGLFCSRADGEMIDRCRAMCDGEAVTCADGDYCGTANSEPFFGFCETPALCDPVYQIGCDEGDACYTLTNDDGDLISDCFEFSPPDDGTGAAGEECMFINNCAAGTRCTPMDTTGDGMLDTATCVPFCLIGDAPDPLPDSELDGSCDMTCEPFELDSEDNVVLTPSTPGLCVAG